MAATETETAASGGGGGGGQAPEAERPSTNSAGVASDAQGDNSSTDDHVRDEKVAPGPTKWQKIKTHFWRFKWWYLLAVAVLLAILLPLLFTVIIPAIIQNVLNGQDLPIKAGTLQAVSPERLEMAINTSLSCPIGVGLDPLELALYNKNTTTYSPFMNLQFPKMHIEGTEDVNLTEQVVPITNQTELLLWFNEFFDKPSVRLSVKGKPTIHLASLKYTRSIDQTVAVPSLNYLDGFGVYDLVFNLNANETKFNMKGMLNIPNSGVLTLGLGDLKFNVMSGNVRLGLINIYDLQLKPGNNSKPFEGNFFFNELVPNLKDVLDSQKGPLGEGYVELFATGNSTTVNGTHIPYLEGVLNRKRIRFTIPVITLLGDVVGGMLGANQGSLLDIFGEAIGNSSLFENALDRWDAETQKKDKASKRGLLKREKSSRSWMLSLLKLGLSPKR